MTLDGVIQNEENDGDGFKHGGWFFPYADEVTGAVVQERLAKPVDLLLGRQDLRLMGNVLAYAFELLAECHDRNQVRRLEYARLKRLAAHRLFERRPGGKSQAVKRKRRAGSARNGKCRYVADAL